MKSLYSVDHNNGSGVGSIVGHPAVSPSAATRGHSNSAQDGEHAATACTDGHLQDTSVPVLPNRQVQLDSGNLLALAELCGFCWGCLQIALQRK